LRVNRSEINGHSIHFEPSKCHGEMTCLRVCPVEAIRVRNGKAKMLEDKCIDCGECVKVCTSNAIIPLTNTFKDFSKFEYTVAIPTLALYSQFDRSIKPKAILTSLKKLGFDEVIDITRACVKVFNALEKYIKEYKGRKPLISSFCPTCVKLIQIRYPELLGNLVPIIQPIELAAREAKKEISVRLGIDKNRVGIIYITPCPSKLILISQKQGAFYSDFDGAIPASDIYNTLFATFSHTGKNDDNDIEYFDISGFGLNFGRLGGIVSLLEGENYLAVGGLNDVVHILEEIERGKLQDIDFVEMNACTEGCIGGSLMVDNIYMARSKMMYLINYFGEKKLPVRKKDPYSEYELFYKNIYEPLPPKPIDVDLKKAIIKITERKEILSRLPNINCGACGSPSCATFAEDIVLGEAKLNDCIFMYNEELKHKLKEKMLELLNQQKNTETK
jgi:iron only hydrogenase large subunit-like protein